MQPGEYLHVHHIYKKWTQLACVFMSADMCMCTYMYMYEHVPNACMAGSFQACAVAYVTASIRPLQQEWNTQNPLKITNVQLYNYKDTQQACNC